MMATSIYSYIWEYSVKEEYLDHFEHIYGPDGDWVKLFKLGEGHIATELHRDTDNPLRFVTVDHWTSKEARNKFKKQFKQEYGDLDKQCESFTESEKFLGNFDCYSTKEHF